MNIKLIIGLGNPGEKYSNTRHNFGFNVIDKLVDELKLDDKLSNKKYQLWIWRTESEKIILLQPLTYMNNSGEAVVELMHFYKINPDEILAIHDDLDLPLGSIRLRVGGSSGGHNGVESIIQHIGTDDFKRVRLGINRPPTNIPAEDYVLQPFPESDQGVVDEVIDQTAQIVVELVTAKREFDDQTIKVA